VKPGDIIFDIGANIGFLTLLFARQTGAKGHVHAFEALPANIHRLKQNIDRNNFQERVTVIPAAVLDKSGPVEFFIGPSTGMGKVEGSAGRDSIEYSDSIQVEGLSIDEYIELGGNIPANIIKIDIEGGEVLAVPGMQKLIHNHRPIVMIELHGRIAAKICWEILNKEKYQICRMALTFPKIYEFQDLNWKSYIVAFPNG
jgi:FkbM family methyltransferase